MAKPSNFDLAAIANYGGAILLTVDDEETAVGSPVQVAASCVTRLKAKAQEFAKTKKEIELNTRFSDAGRAAELNDYCTRTLHELGRIDASLELAQTKLDDLQAEARKVSIDLTPAQLALVPSVYARLVECDPLELPGLLTEAATERDVVTLAAFMAAPRSKLMRLAVSNDQLDQAGERLAGALSPADRKVLSRMRQLVDAAMSLRKDLVRDLKKAAGLEQDPVMAMLGVEPGTTVDDPIARMALGLDAETKDDAPAKAA